MGVPMIVSKWSPKAEDEEQEEEAIPMWVHPEKVPLHMYSWEGLSFITSAVGLPVKPHQDTIACTKLDEAKIFVKVDFSKVLSKEITFTKNGKSFTVNFYYHWLPERCKSCDKWGHNESVCGSKGKGKRSRIVRSPSQEVVVSEEESAKPQNTAKGEVAGNEVSVQEKRTVIYNTRGRSVEERKWKMKLVRVVVLSKDGLQSHQPRQGDLCSKLRRIWRLLFRHLNSLF